MKEITLTLSPDEFDHLWINYVRGSLDDKHAHGETWPDESIYQRVRQILATAEKVAIGP